jgi:Bacterial Ig-like domain (group 3)
MFDANEPDAPDTPHGGHHRSSKVRRSMPIVGISLAVVGGLIVGSQTMFASAEPGAVQGSSGHRSAALVPPAGTTWIEGVITDQANHAQDNVNVEAWPRNPKATAPIASSLTYGGPPNNPRYKHGFFVLEVPSDKAYRIVFSGVGAKEDGDRFRMKSYGGGRPIMVRNLVSASGRIRNLGVVPLARQGHVASKTKATLSRAKIASGKSATLRVKVTSRFVTNVTGKVVVRAGGKKMTHRLSHSKETFKLPKLKKAGKYKITASYTGSGTVHGSKAKTVKLTVQK